MLKRRMASNVRQAIDMLLNHRARLIQGIDKILVKMEDREYKKINFPRRIIMLMEG